MSFFSFLVKFSFLQSTFKPDIVARIASGSHQGPQTEFDYGRLHQIANLLLIFEYFFPSELFSREITPLHHTWILKMWVCISNQNVCGWVEVAEWNKDDPSPSITIMWIISFRERKLKSKKSSSPDFIFKTTAAISCQAYLNRYAFNFIFTSSWCTFPNWWTNIFAPCCSRPTPSLCWAESKIWRKKSPFQSFLPCSRYLDIKKKYLP